MAAEIPHERAIHDMKKEELVAFIKEAKGIKDEPHVKHKHTHHKIILSKEQLKARIRELKDLKVQALEADDRKKINGAVPSNRPAQEKNETDRG